MRRLLVLITVLALVTAGCGGIDPGEPAPDIRAAALAVEQWRECGGWEGEDLELQRRLVRWYGINLRSRQPEPGFREAYDSILAGPGGIMGWVEFNEATLPLFHEGSVGEGFLHQLDTPFPTGEYGTAVLRLSGDQTGLWAAWLAPKTGDSFRIHILDTVVTYRIQSAERGEPLLHPADTDSRCLLVIDWDDERLVIVGVPEKP